MIGFFAANVYTHTYQKTQGLIHQEITSKNVNSSNRELTAAGNSTLGFSSIQFINLKNRFDRVDAVTLQGYLTGLDIIEVPGVESDQIHEMGMPPNHRPVDILLKEKACFRAHANIWSQMLRDKSPAVLILESDAAWDINVREIMTHLNPHFTTLLRQLNSTPIHNAGWDARNSRAATSHDLLQPNPDDPWHSSHWDVLSLGQCLESPVNHESSVTYSDEHVAAGKEYFGKIMGRERVVRLSGGFVCLTAYVVSQTGAAKLLLRHAVDLDAPVDLIIRGMIGSGDLVTYSVMPTVFAQWEYLNNIGMKERGSNSDIHGVKMDNEIDLTGWEDVKRTGSVWHDKEGHPDIAFRNMALEKAWSLILPNAKLD
ncbi:hypothetical protein QQS21_011013 [Conoideocrella luteorostrata]|uniref:Glycosyl transferase family 25 domain-containing protein n=1 Tax=Conoideocrella luteorostrata TaxID=1105319 RepID=A0AAJ0CE73_9HYPO|nr:hypothetical protein QQS21_011013 [Conoideocrella luteorostrata]